MSAQPARTQSEAAPSDLTYDERKILMHAMGLNRSRVAYRNVFVASPSHSDLPVLEALASKGFMVKETSAINPDFIFRATSTGKQALKRYYWRQ